MIFFLFFVCGLEVDGMILFLIFLFKVVVGLDDWLDGCLWNVEFLLVFIVVILDGEFFDDLVCFFFGILVVEYIIFL